MEEFNKKITTVYIDEEIKKFCKSNKLNLSDWINLRFNEEFLTTQTKLRRVIKLRSDANLIEKEVKVLKKNVRNIIKTFSSEQLGFVCEVNKLVDGGFDLQAIRRRFNSGFGSSFSLSEFEQIVLEIEMGDN